jgi:hypothetical protein
MESISLALAASMLAASAPPGDHPIHLKADVADGSVRLEVVGLAAADLEADYTLEVQSGGSAGKTHTVQKGRARLDAGRFVKLNSVNLGGSAQNEWSASLDVRLASGEAYNESLRSSGTR